MIESCWASPFNQVLAREILDRLGMQDSVPGQDLEHPDLSTSVLFEATTLARYQRVLSRIAQPYRVDSRGRPTLAEFPPRGINAAAGLVSTARDLAKYDRALNDHILLRLETQELAWTPSRTTTGQLTPYGLGWFVQIVDGERVVWHYGLWGGSYSSLMLKVPARRMSLILLANSDGLSASFPMAAGTSGCRRIRPYGRLGGDRGPIERCRRRVQHTDDSGGDQCGRRSHRARPSQVRGARRRAVLPHEL